jgi:hypothetical protein
VLESVPVMLEIGLPVGAPPETDAPIPTRMAKPSIVFGAVAPWSSAIPAPTTSPPGRAGDGTDLAKFENLEPKRF